MLTRPGDAAHLGARIDVTFSDLEMVDITPFLILRVTDGRGQTRGTVVHAALTGDPPGRRDELLARQVNTPEKFLRFLALLLSLGGSSELAGLLGGRPGTTGAGSWNVGPVGVFETLLRALGAKTSALADIAPLVERLRRTETGRQVLPEGFEELWDLVWKAHMTIAETSS